MVADLFRSRSALEAEILTLRQQINILRRTAFGLQYCASRIAFNSTSSLKGFIKNW
jgi:hypothetical protein